MAYNQSRENKRKSRNRHQASRWSRAFTENKAWISYHFSGQARPTGLRLSKRLQWEHRRDPGSSIQRLIQWNHLKYLSLGKLSQCFLNFGLHERKKFWGKLNTWCQYWNSSNMLRLPPNASPSNTLPLCKLMRQLARWLVRSSLYLKWNSVLNFIRPSSLTTTCSINHALHSSPFSLYVNHLLRLIRLCRKNLRRKYWNSRINSTKLCEEKIPTKPKVSSPRTNSNLFGIERSRQGGLAVGSGRPKQLPPLKGAKA